MKTPVTLTAYLKENTDKAQLNGESKK